VEGDVLGKRGLEHVDAVSALSGGHRFLDAFEQIIDDAAHDLQKEVFLAVDVVVETADLKPGDGGHLA
jgi:hypothetical protein